MTGEEGLNLAGVETVLELERTVERMRAELARMRERAAEMERRFEREVEQVRRSLKAEIVPYGAYDVIPAEGSKTVKIPVQRPQGPPPPTAAADEAGAPARTARVGRSWAIAGRTQHRHRRPASGPPAPFFDHLDLTPATFGARTLARMTGVRDLGFAALTMVARERPRDALRRAALISGAADAIDCAAFGAVAVRREGAVPTLVLSSLSGAAAAVLSAWAAERLSAGRPRGRNPR